jgi:hypothetical protein
MASILAKDKCALPDEHLVPLFPAVFFFRMTGFAAALFPEPAPPGVYLIPDESAPPLRLCGKSLKSLDAFLVRDLRCRWVSFKGGYLT